ncbi:hypothetical protein [Flavobacterium sp. 102]|uniref:hypothetical protein n=1 Tax=Flavobacterium sp. 102 TaxID=2135623 RepID=UPI000EAC4EA5|nr:hypothetical protein [Flavobacterium sp. 102]RKS03132.1 hypothetical protein C8C84_2874 [Flavobacterium sp. 102]
MKDLELIAVAQHSKNIKKGMRNLLILIVLCIVLMIVARLFYEGRVHEAIVYRKGARINAEVGWPATLFSIGSWGLVAFPLFLAYLFFKQDLKQPAVGVSNEGLFINQQLLRKAFVSWDNIEHVELRGHISNPILRVFFKDVDVLLKGQFFIFKSIAKATLKSNPSLGISKDEAVGDLVSMFDFIKEKGVTVQDRMEGRTKI